jgi:pyruvate/2-oxoglutarate/acetoin dehydrogenase E1 component
MTTSMARELRFFEAVRDALDVALETDPRVFVMGLGVPDPKGIFGTTVGLSDTYGPDRVCDMPTSENGMTGVAIGASLTGMRPVMIHQRIDFAVLAMEQIVNQAAKWRYMYGGRAHVPLVIRLIVGRGWGQGPQHSQSLHSWFAHVPGLKVVMPVTPHDAKGLLLAAIDDDDPVVYVEHRWLHPLYGEVPEGHYHVPIGSCQTLRAGDDVTIAATSYMAVEAVRVADALARAGIGVDVIAVTSLRPLDRDTILASVQRTGRFVIADTSWATAGFSAELSAVVAEGAFDSLTAPPCRVTTEDTPIPTTPALAAHSYPRGAELIKAVAQVLGRDPAPLLDELGPDPERLDVPDASFTGPF